MDRYFGVSIVFEKSCMNEILSTQYIIIGACLKKDGAET